MYKKIIVLTILLLTGGIYCMDTMPTLQSSKLLLDSWSIAIHDNKWFIQSPYYQKPMEFSQSEIAAIINMIPHDQRALFINNDNDSLSYLIDYISQHNIIPSAIPQDTSRSPQPIKSPSNNVKQTSELEYKVIMDRVKKFTRSLPHTIAVPKISINKKMLEYRYLQMQGNLSKLEFEKKEMENALKEANPLLCNTIFKEWAKEVQKRINSIQLLLNMDITKKLNVMRTGSLTEAEAIVNALKKQWPYSQQIVTSQREVQEIRSYFYEVGFNELNAALNLLTLRRDYHIKLAEKIYTGEKVTQYESQLAQKASQYLEYQQQLQQRELRIEHLKSHPDELPIYKEFLSNNPGELKHIPIDGNILSVEQFRQWCEQRTAQQELIKELSSGVQPHVIQILESTHDNTIVAQKLDVTINAVLSHAYANNYLVAPEIDWRLQAALNALPKSVDPKDFTFHMATIEHLLNDIQMQTAFAAHEQSKLIERSPQLLAQAVTKYFEYLAPTEGELSLIADLARYVSDVTLGTEYLPAEVRAQRIETFWNTVNNISFKNLSNLSAEQVVDGGVYVAARATYACGVPAAISVIKDVMEGIRTASFFAERFKKGFDQAIHDNPIIIADEGTVIYNASKEAVAEARQIIQAFDGMKDKPSGKKPPEILDDTKKVVEKEVDLNKEYEILSEKIQESLKDLTVGGNKIKKLAETQVLKPKHVFSPAHKADGIMRLGENEEIIVKRIIDIIKKADHQNMINEGVTRLQTRINGHNVEIRAFVKNESLWSIDTFIGHSTRPNPLPIKFFI